LPGSPGLAHSSAGINDDWDAACVAYGTLAMTRRTSELFAVLMTLKRSHYCAQDGRFILFLPPNSLDEINKNDKVRAIISILI
jgi:hypothetical protein